MNSSKLLTTLSVLSSNIVIDEKYVEKHATVIKDYLREEGLEASPLLRNLLFLMNTEFVKSSAIDSFM